MSVKLGLPPIDQMGRLQRGVNGVREAQVDLEMRPLCGGSGRQCETPNPNTSNRGAPSRAAMTSSSEINRV
jgi:hypothetical protein